MNKTHRASLHLTIENLDAIDAGIITRDDGTGARRSGRINGMLERFRKIVDHTYEDLVGRFSYAELQRLADALFADGSPGSWLLGWANTQFELGVEFPNDDECIVNFFGEHPLVEKVLKLTPAEAAVIEEFLAVNWEEQLHE